MPIKVLPDQEAFAVFRHRLLARGFKELTKEEIKTMFRKINLEPPSFREGPETGLTFTANGLEVFVWTSYLANEKKSRDFDQGWILIIDKGRIRYSSYPMMRTKFFLLKMARRAWIAKRRATHRPVCPKCGRFMRIAYGRGMKSRYWRCDYKSEHDTHAPEFKDWDICLPPKAKAFVKKERKIRRRYRNKRTKLGKPNFVAIKRRRKWKNYREENPRLFPKKQTVSFNS